MRNHDELHGTRGEDGVLEYRLTAREARVRVGDRDAHLLTYDGSFPGPTLRAREGDRVRIVFENALSERTNLHFHGMRMPTEVDDPHRVVCPGERTTYEFDIPAGAAGTYWYHPHLHGEVAWQLGAGLVGAMVVHGPIDDAVLGDADEQVLVLHDLSLAGDRPRPRSVLEMHDGREGELVLVHGDDARTIHAKGGLLRLRLVNGSTARFFDVAVDGAETALIGLDSNLLEAPVPIESVLLPPGQRADVLVRADRAGVLLLRERPYDRGVVRLPGMAPTPRPADGILATIVVHGDAEVRFPERMGAVERIDPGSAVRTRRLEYGGEGNTLRFLYEALRGTQYGPGQGARGPVRFAIDGRSFDPHRIDFDVELGTTEIWEIANPTPLDHPFHLHIHGFQLIDVDGEPAPFVAWRDVVNVPRGKTVRIAVPFRDHPGTTMFHCHIVEHEDNGMMGHVRVVDPSAPRVRAPREACR